MYFFVDNTEQDELIFFISKDGLETKDYHFDLGGEGALLSALDEIIKKENINKTDIAGVAVRVGKGRFTGTRVATTFANSLGFALQIPVCAVESNDPAEAFKVLKSTPIGQYAPPRYSSEPRLGIK